MISFMKNISLYTFIFTFLIGIFPIKSITLEECQKLAKENYPLIKQYEIINISTRYDISNANKGYLPNISTLLQATWQNSVMSFPDQIKEAYSKMGMDLNDINKDQYKIGIDIYQNIWDGGDIKAKNKINTLSNKVNNTSVDVELYSIIDRVNNLYFGILLLQKQLNQNEDLRNILKNNCDKINSLLRNGVSTESDLALMEAELLTANQNKINMEYTQSSYVNMLSLFLGKAINAGSLETPNKILIDDSENKRPEESLFKARKELANANLAQINSSIMPKIGAFAQGYYGNPGFNMFEDMTKDRWTFNFLVGVKVTWNIGSLYQRSNNIHKIALSSKSIDIENEVFNFNNNLQVVQKKKDIENYELTMKEDDKIISLRELIRKSSEAKLNNGVYDANDLLQDINKEDQSKILKNYHEIELLKSMYDLKYLINY